MQEVREDA
jgi:hypothetical protein